MSDVEHDEKPLPQGWKWVRLGDVCTSLSGGTPSKAKDEYWKGTIPWISPKDMKHYVLDDAKDHISEGAVAGSATTIAPQGAVLVLIRGMGLANGLPVCKLSRSCAFNQDIRAFIPNDNITSDFLSWVIRSRAADILNRKDVVTHGTLKLNTSLLIELKFPLPSIEKQKNICEDIQHQIDIADIARAAAQARLEAIRALPAAYLREVFPKQDEELPAGWKLVQLGDVCTVVGGSTPSSGNTSFWNGNITWITPTDLGQLVEKSIVSSQRHITEYGRASCNLDLLPRGSVIISSRAPIGYLGIAGEELCINQGCKAFIPNANLDSCFLYYSLMKDIEVIKQKGSGATFIEVSKGVLEKHSIAIPVHAMQIKIANILDVQHAFVKKVRAAAEAELAAIEALPAAILRKAFNGEL